jgi:predicted CoA-substrate-specific enzyme activase
MLVGMDLGSVSLNTVILDDSRTVLYENYIRIKGRPLPIVLEELQEVFTRYDSYDGLVFTGSGGKLLASILGLNFVNEIIAQAKSIEYLYPEVKTIIDIGGEDSKIIEIERDDKSKKFVIKDFSMNTMCAAGTGSFLDQQASRLGIAIEKEFGEMAMKSKNPPRIAGRCSVFAKSDMIHLQQEATPVYDIVAGLCFAMVRNLKGTQGKGRDLEKPFSFHGGVVANEGIIRAIKEIFQLDDKELIIPKYYTSMGAIGAIYQSIEDKKLSRIDSNLIQNLTDYIESKRATSGVLLKSLEIVCSERKKVSIARTDNLKMKEVEVYLGIDIGSISTNVVAINKSGEVLSKRYLMTAGRPIDAVKQGLLEVGQELDSIGLKPIVKSAGTTGSGRYLIGELIGADIVKNEITAQARAAAEIDPNVDTIFEIGGQDSKFISLENGVVVDFEMNKVCAAGTGSFLEEQAEKLNISIKEEFGNLALSSSNPTRLGERCTVFMESDIVSQQQKGAITKDIVAGLSYSIVYNYLNRVVGNKKVGNNIFFQGGVAFNDGVLAAFENVTGKKITVPPHHEVTGAIGIALIARDEVAKVKSDFKGFDIGKKSIQVEPFECKDCSNLCEIKKVVVEGESPLYFGSRCEKYEIREKTQEIDIPDLFKERRNFLEKFYKLKNRQGDRIRIGIPRALSFYDLFPLYSAFFIELGCEVVLSDRSNKEIIHNGSELVNAEICLPVKIAHGHIRNLLKKKVDYIFIPSVISVEGFEEKFTNNFNCPYVQTIHNLINAAFDFKDNHEKLLSPVLRFQMGKKDVEKALVKTAKELGYSSFKAKAAVRKAFDAQREFKESLVKKSIEVEKLMESYKPSVVIVSRGYNGYDLGINLNLPKKFRDLGILPIPLDFLPLHKIKLSEDWVNMYWQYGQKFLKAVEYIKDKPGLFSVYITNFSCGPDSFLITFFKKLCKGKPFLQMELDEHSADAGAVTRCEAFIDSLKNIKNKEIFEVKDISIHVPKSNGKNRIVYIPRMSDHSFALESAFKLVGVDARIMPESDEETLIRGRKYTSGKECYPCIITTGDIVKICTSDDFVPEKTAFFMPSTSGPCRFGQYNKFQKLVVDELGFRDVIFVAPNQHTHDMYKSSFLVPEEFFTYAWLGVVVIDYLDKLLRKIRPYELNRGETERVYRESLKNICKDLGSERFHESIAEAVDNFKKIKIDFSTRRPVIGIVGEVFVRANRFSNNDLVGKIESLGGEVHIPPIIEWLNYTNYTHVIHAIEEKDFLTLLKSLITNYFQKRYEHKIAYHFRDLLNPWKEVDPKVIMKLSEEYITTAYEGEAVLSIGKTIEFMENGACGIINTMPFTCMPGTIVASILKRVRIDKSIVPVLSICYDGQEEVNELNRLEAFMHQAHQIHRMRSSKNSK